MKKYELHGNQFILTEMVKLNHRENHHLYKNRHHVANECEVIGEFALCNTVNPDCCYDKSILNRFASVHCPIQKYFGKTCVHKTTFQSLDRSKYQCPQGTSICHVRKMPLKE